MKSMAKETFALGVWGNFPSLEHITDLTSPWLDLTIDLTSSQNSNQMFFQGYGLHHTLTRLPFLNVLINIISFNK